MNLRLTLTSGFYLNIFCTFHDFCNAWSVWSLGSILVMDVLYGLVMAPDKLSYYY